MNKIYDLYDKWVEDRIADLRNYPFRDIIHEVTEDTLNFSRINLKRIIEEVKETMSKEKKVKLPEIKDYERTVYNVHNTEDDIYKAGQRNILQRVKESLKKQGIEVE